MKLLLHRTDMFEFIEEKVEVVEITTVSVTRHGSQLSNAIAHIWRRRLGVVVWHNTWSAMEMFPMRAKNRKSWDRKETSITRLFVS